MRDAGGERDRAARVLGHHRLERVLTRRALGPPEQGPVARLDRRHELVVLLVVHEQRYAFARAHVAELGTGEVGVEIQGARSPLRGGEGDVEEAAVVAAQDPDGLPFPHAAGP